MKKTIFILTLLLPIGLLCAQSHVSQNGSFNFVDVDQVGIENHSDVSTTGDFNAFSFVNQEGNGFNDSDVDQLNNGNRVNVNQVNDVLKFNSDNYSTINQTGNWNSAMVDQVMVNSLVPLGGKLTAEVEQKGDYNMALVKQEGYVVVGTITQKGDLGIANQFQGTSYHLPPGSIARVSDATIMQRENVDGFSRAEQHQAGWQNTANIDQDAGGFSKAVQIQINERGTFTGAPFSPLKLNDADINQRGGDGNKAMQLQVLTGDAPGNAAPNVASLEQIGNGNWSREIQVGGDTESTVYQKGDGNVSDVFQNVNSVIVPGIASLPPFFY